MGSSRHLTVEPDAAGQRLDRFLATCGTWGTRSHVQRLIAAGGVRLDGRVVKSSTTVRAGQAIEVCEPPMELRPGRVEAEPIGLDVLHEDEWLLVINKPAGLVVHPAPGHWRGTLVSALLHHLGGPRGGLDPLRPGIVHRLDKDTSGILVVAKDAVTLAALSAQFKRREVEKRYIAVVWGRLRTSRGMIQQPIGRNPVQRKRMAVRAGGREAVTAYEVLERFDDATVLRLAPRTGRTHQLRVHLAAIGHPIIGDALYGGGRRRGGERTSERQALHAERIVFLHPHDRTQVRFAAPLPDDMQLLLRRLRSAA